MSRNILKTSTQEKLAALSQIIQDNPSDAGAVKQVMKPHELSRLRSEINQGAAKFFQQYLDQMELLYAVSKHIGGIRKEELQSMMGEEVSNLASFISHWIPESNRVELIHSLLLGWNPGNDIGIEKDHEPVLASIEAYLNRFHFYDIFADSDVVDNPIEGARDDCLTSLRHMRSMLEKDPHRFTPVIYDSSIEGEPLRVIYQGERVDDKIDEMDEKLNEIEGHRSAHPSIKEDPLALDRDGDDCLTATLVNDIRIPRAVLSMLVKGRGPPYNFDPAEIIRRAQQPMHLKNLVSRLQYEVDRGSWILIERPYEEHSGKPTEKITLDGLNSLAEGDVVPISFGGKLRSYQLTHVIETAPILRSLGCGRTLKIPQTRTVEAIGHFYDNSRGGRRGVFQSCLNQLVEAGFIDWKGNYVNLTREGINYAIRSPNWEKLLFYSKHKVLYFVHDAKLEGDKPRISKAYTQG